MVTAPKMETLVTAIYPEADTYLTNDAVFGVKRSLVVVRPSPDCYFFHWPLVSLY